jgi:hypothetical protein
MSDIERKANGSRYFTDEFKREAVRLATERGSVEETAREFGIRGTMLHRYSPTRIGGCVPRMCPKPFKAIVVIW